VEAVLQAWYPGQQFGAALASVLFGDSDRRAAPHHLPGRRGRAGPPTRPEPTQASTASSATTGIFVGHRWYDQFRQQPLFPFGYGLSYADFRFGDLRVRSDHGGVTRRRVTNTSRRLGRRRAGLPVLPAVGRRAAAPAKGYEKVQLAPGRSAVVSFRLDRADLAYFDEGTHGQVVADGRYTLSVGSSSRDLPESASFELGGRGQR
jgi:beta-glucosidase